MQTTADTFHSMENKENHLEGSHRFQPHVPTHFRNNDIQLRQIDEDNPSPTSFLHERSFGSESNTPTESNECPYYDPSASWVSNAHWDGTCGQTSEMHPLGTDQTSDSEPLYWSPFDSKPIDNGIRHGSGHATLSSDINEDPGQSYSSHRMENHVDDSPDEWTLQEEYEDHLIRQISSPTSANSLYRNVSESVVMASANITQDYLSHLHQSYFESLSQSGLLDIFPRWNVCLLGHSYTCQHCKLPNLIGSCELTSRLISRDEHDENSSRSSVGKTQPDIQARVNERRKLRKRPYPPPMHVSTIFQWSIFLSCASPRCQKVQSRYLDASNTLPNTEHEYARLFVDRIRP